MHKVNDNVIINGVLLCSAVSSRSKTRYTSPTDTSFIFAFPLLVRDGSVNTGTKFAHSDKSVKLGRHVHWTLLFDKTNGSTLGNKWFR